MNRVTLLLLLVLPFAFADWSIWYGICDFDAGGGEGGQISELIAVRNLTSACEGVIVEEDITAEFESLNPWHVSSVYL